MREIKFRAWDVARQEWLLGYEYPSLGGFSMFGEVMMMGEYAALLSGYFPENLDDIALMQYTGLKDSKGVEIYEGDIVEYLYRDGYIKKYIEVKWRNMRQYTGFNITNTRRAELKVIGNIYENPELLTAPNQLTK
jgi:uncharacterized phage protein (TIGR01671 family)